MISNQTLQVRDKIDNSDSWSEDESSSSSSSESSLDLSFIKEQAPKDDLTKQKTEKAKHNVKTKGELDLDDLPPIEELTISIKEDEMKNIGLVYAIVDKLVVVRSHKDECPLDLDSVLFLGPDKPLGKIFDVFGPVGEPFYSIRFNDPEDINKKGVKVDALVYFAPTQPEPITRYVFLQELQSQRGSDASWKDNNEPPEQFVDYSDDEQEKTARKNRRTNHEANFEDGIMQNNQKTAVCSQNKPPFVSQRKSIRNFSAAPQTSTVNPFSIARVEPYQNQIMSQAAPVPSCIPRSPAVQFQNSTFWTNPQPGLNQSIFQKDSSKISPAVHQTSRSPFLPESQRSPMQPVFGSQPLFMFPNLQSPPPTFRYPPVFRAPPPPLSFQHNFLAIPVVHSQNQANNIVPNTHHVPSPVTSTLSNQNLFSTTLNRPDPRINWFQGQPVCVSPPTNFMPSSLPTSTPLSVQIPNNSGAASPAVGTFPVQFIPPSTSPLYLSHNNQPSFFKP